MTTTCPVIASADDADVELSSYSRDVGTVVVVECTGFGQHVDPAVVQCGANGQWSPTPSTDCSFDLNDREKLLLGIWIGAGCLFIFGILWIVCYCCWCWRKDRVKYRYRKFWRTRDRDADSEETPDDYRKTRQYRETFGDYAADSPRSTRKEINIYNIRDDNRLTDRRPDDYRESGIYKTTFDRRRDDRSDYSDRPDYRKSRRIDYSQSDARDYRESRRYRRDSDLTHREYRDTRRHDRDNDRGYRDYRHSRRYDSDDELSHRAYRNRNRHDRDYRETRRYDRDDNRLDHGHRVTRRYDNDPPPYRESEIVRYIDRPVPVFVDRHQPFSYTQHVSDDDIILREKPHHRNNYSIQDGFYGNEINATLAPFEIDSDTVYVKYHLGKKPIGDNIVPSMKIVELGDDDRVKDSEYTSTEVTPYNKNLAKSRGRETGVYGQETNYFFGRQDFQLHERDPIVNHNLDHVLYHGNGKSTEIFENGDPGRPLSAAGYFGDTAGWKEW